MQEKIRAAPTLVYPESDGEPIYDPVKSAWLFTSQERVAQESLARQEAESRAQQAEAELEKLRAALQRLQSSE